jgi:hypothetical protein
MTPPVRYVFDLEVLVPSSLAKNEVLFWDRLSTWLKDTRPSVGEKALEGMYSLYLNPPATYVISPVELAKLIGRASSRVHARADVDVDRRHVCHLPWIDSYAPRYGAPDNARGLTVDVNSLEKDAVVFIASDPECWPDLLADRCEECGERRTIAYAYNDDRVARTLRAIHLEAGLRKFEDLQALAPSLFPRLVFSHTAWNRVGTLSGAEPELVSKIAKHLSVLNDRVLDIWEASGQANVRSQELASLGIDASMEGVNTRGSERLMSHRDFDFAVGPVRCEWHTKFEPHRGRIHFKVLNDVVYIGTIEEHLPT